MKIHQMAIVEDGAKLGADVTIDAFSYIHAGAVIGDGSWIGPQAVIYGSTILGEECRVHAGVILGDTPQDLGFSGGKTYVRIGDRCTFREGVTIHKGTKEGSTTHVGNDCLFMANSHVAHNCVLGDNVILTNGALLGGYVEVGDGAFISANCLVHQFVRIGRLAMLGGNSGANKDVPPFCMIHPYGLNRLSGLNMVGLRRAQMTASERKELKESYRILFMSTTLQKEALARIRETMDSQAVLELCSFIEASKRGVCIPHQKQ